MDKETTTTYIWGAGHFGVLTALDCEQKGIKVAGFIDGNANQIKTRLGLPVLTFEQVQGRGGQIIIAIQNKNAIREISEKLKAFGMDFEVSSIILNSNKQKNYYYCKALTGMSDYNISINSDMTVSCSCQYAEKDFLLGDLNKNSLQEIFEGKLAMHMRKSLAEGFMPTKGCCSCRELVNGSKFAAHFYAQNFSVPHLGIQVENTFLCNYKCIHCPSKTQGNNRASHTISIKQMEKIAIEFQKHKMKGISLFKLGEPFMDKDILSKIKILREKNPDLKITTSTNGCIIDSADKIQAALLLDAIAFSIDGTSTENQNNYQQNANFQVVIDNVKKIIIARGKAKKPTLTWKYVVFSWNDESERIAEAFKLAKTIGFDTLNFTIGGTPNEKERSKRFYNEADFIPLSEQYRLIWASNTDMNFRISEQ